MKQHIIAEQLFLLPYDKISRLYCYINDLNFENTNYDVRWFKYVEKFKNYSPHKEFIERFLNEITIGKIIEILGQRYENISQNSNIFYVSIKAFPIGDGFLAVKEFKDEELCDALWNAVISILSED